MEGIKDGVPVDVAMLYNTGYSENVSSFVNNINTHEGGTHVSGFRMALTRTLKTTPRNRVFWLKKKSKLVVMTSVKD